MGGPIFSLFFLQRGWIFQTGLGALALLIAESNPRHNYLMIRLIVHLITIKCRE
jgi:hypothetical protein